MACDPDGLFVAGTGSIVQYGVLQCDSTSTLAQRDEKNGVAMLVNMMA
jgi:hypothetical protein